MLPHNVELSVSLSLLHNAMLESNIVRKLSLHMKSNSVMNSQVSLRETFSKFIIPICTGLLDRPTIQDPMAGSVIQASGMVIFEDV